jgi:hypothetical protein
VGTLLESGAIHPGRSARGHLLALARANGIPAAGSKRFSVVAGQPEVSGQVVPVVIVLRDQAGHLVQAHGLRVGGGDAGEQVVSLVGARRRSAHHWEHEMGDAVALNADRWVAEQHVVSRELAEEGAVALAHHDRDEVDGVPPENSITRLTCRFASDAGAVMVG